MHVDNYRMYMPSAMPATVHSIRCVDTLMNQMFPTESDIDKWNRNVINVNGANRSYRRDNCDRLSSFPSVIMFELYGAMHWSNC